MAPTRRRYLAALSGATTLAIAGCSDADSTPTDATPTESLTPTDTPTATPGTTVPGTPTPTPSDGYTPPPYVDPGAYTATSVTLDATAECTLGGELTVPTGEGPVPGVVLVHGSGRQNRNGAIGGVQIYRDLALGLASRGVAVLRYDKRTFACTQQLDPSAFTIDDVVTDDALLAVDRLREHPRVASEDVFVVGHSLGGALAPRIAARDGGLAGIAMLAANASPLPDLVVAQTRYALERDGDLTEAERQQLNRVRELAERARTVDIGDDEVVLGGGKPFWRSLAEYDQVETATNLDVPTFLGQGTRDRNVPVDTELGQWRDALGGRASVTIRTYDGVNHYFLEGPGPLETGQLPQSGHVVPAVVADLAAFVTD